MLHRFFFIKIFLLSYISIAQTPPYTLPLSFQGTGSLQTAVFSSNVPWKANVTSNALAIINLYNERGQNLGTILQNEVVELTGTYYLIVETTGTWNISLNTVVEDSNLDTTTNTTTNLKTSTPISVSLPMIRFGYGIKRYVRPTPSELNDSKQCSDFTTLFEAQDLFISVGGPELDPYNLDSDGDGYVCNYHPKEAYTPPITCDAGTEWQNPRYRNKDGKYVKGTCIPLE